MVQLERGESYTGNHDQKDNYKYLCQQKIWKSPFLFTAMLEALWDYGVLLCKIIAFTSNLLLHNLRVSK